MNHKEANDAYYQRCQQEMETYDVKRLRFEAIENACDHDSDQMEREFFQTTRDAAKAGNVDAQLCFMQDDFLVRARTQDDIDEYDRDSSVYLDSAIKRGDWRAVALMSTDPHYLPHSETLLSQLVPGDAVTAFEMNRLMRMAAHGPFAVTLDSDGRDLLNSLSDQQALRADAWAKQQYEKYFRGSGDLSALPVVCGE